MAFHLLPDLRSGYSCLGFWRSLCCGGCSLTPLGGCIPDASMLRNPPGIGCPTDLSSGRRSDASPRGLASCSVSLRSVASDLLYGRLR